MENLGRCIGDCTIWHSESFRMIVHAGTTRHTRHGLHETWNGILYTLGYGASGHDGYFIAKYVGGNNPTGSWVRSGGDLCGSNCIK